MYSSSGTIGWSQFACQHSRRGTGNSYTELDPMAVVALVREHWDQREPGAGEQGRLDRKVVVPVPPTSFYCPPRVSIRPGLPVKARVVTRQNGEDPYVETYCLESDLPGFQPTPAQWAKVVLYGRETLLENGGKPTTDCDWEIVCVLAGDGDTKDDMLSPLTMARNQLQKPGGSYSEYTALEYAEAIYRQATTQTIRVLETDPETPKAKLWAIRRGTVWLRRHQEQVYTLTANRHEAVTFGTRLEAERQLLPGEEIVPVC